MRKFNSLLVLIVLSLAPLTLIANIPVDINNYPPSTHTTPEQIEALTELNRVFAEEDHPTLRNILSHFNIIQYGLRNSLPDEDPLLKHGALQEHYLTILAKIFRGGQSWNYEFAEEEQFKSGKRVFLITLSELPLDQKGIDLLKAFIMGFKGGERLTEIQIELIQEINKKKPTFYTYDDYEYQEVLKERSPVFEYDSFNFNESNIDFPENYEELKAKEKIQKFPELMQKNLKGSKDQIQRVHALLKENYINPEKKINITLLGTSGNGKTQFAKAMGIALFGNKDAMKKLTFTGKTGELSDYFRSSTGYVGSNEPTDFEKWFVGRIEKGIGGIIVLDELLSFHGLTPEQIGNKVQTINELYDLLDERVVKIANKIYDMSKFHVVITGNSLQEFFLGLEDNPDFDKELKQILKRITKKDIINYFNKVGIDAPKIARFGEIFVNGPLNKVEVKEVSQYMLKDSLRGLDEKVKLTVDPAILDGIVSRLSTVELGMREITIGLSKLIMSSINGILFDIPQARYVEAKLIKDKIYWFVDGKEVVLNSTLINKDSGLEERVWGFKEGSDTTEDRVKIKTPQFEDLDVTKQVKVEKLELYITSVHEVKGHWMVNTLLTGQNEAQTISNIPSGKALGFVMPKRDDEVKASVLTRLLKRNMMLEAGHRAPILEGFYATGGGNANSKKGEMPTDDLGKVNLNLDQILANHIFKRYTDVSDEKVTQRFREVLRDLLKESTDYVINYGNETGFADELLELSMKDRFLTEEVLDNYAEKQLSKTQLDRDVLFFKALDDGVQKLLAEYENVPKKEALLRVEMLKSIVDSSFVETKKIREFLESSDELIESIQEVKRHSMDLLSRYESKKKNGCYTLLNRLSGIFKKRT